uniref:Uncharacterized protein n=1 Tax=Panagrolaimus davidi TaxID=227884 RepID=A0A914QN95_9BILA
MKGIFIVFLCVIAITLVHCRTVGQALDAGINEVRQDAKAVGRVVTAPVRFVGHKASQAVSATRHAAGGVVEGAGSSLRHAGQHISGRHS